MVAVSFNKTSLILAFTTGPPVQCIKVPRAYPREPRESCTKRVPYSSQDNVVSGGESNGAGVLYPQLPDKVNEIDPYGGYGAPTYPRQSPRSGEKTPLLP